MTTLLHTRGTDVVAAAIKCGDRFNAADIERAYRDVRQGRGDVLNEHWRSGIRNEMQRLSSDAKQFNGDASLDLFAFLPNSRGWYSLRDNARPQLISAANKCDVLYRCETRLLIPAAKTPEASAATNHLVGNWAQARIMQWARDKGYRVIEDSSRSNAYDFTFRLPERWATPQTMECKGSRAERGDVVLTPNEMRVLYENYHNHWLGFVCNIQIGAGVIFGGDDPFIIEPPALDRLAFIKPVRLRMQTAPIDGHLPLFGGEQ
jgi:hypothetical protein